jgi:integrase
MKGTIVKRGNRYSVVVELDRHPITGKRRREWHSGYRTKRDAEAARVEILSRMQRGEYVSPSKLTTGAYLTDEWLPAMRASLRSSTYESYRSVLEQRVVPRIGTVPLQRLTAPALNSLYGKLGREHKLNGEDRPPLSPRSIRYTHAILRHALSDAERWGRVARNVADLAEPPSAKAARAPEMRTWTAEQLRTFLEHVREDRLYAAYHLAAMTGMRRGELLGLRWRDVDLDTGRVSIVQTLIGKRELSRPKTDKGRRNVALDPATVTVLREHRKDQLEERLAWGPAYEDEHDLVFSREDGSPTWPQSLSRAFERHAGDAGMPVIRFHDLRHTHATLALTAGVHPKVVSERLGHANVAITLDTYSHAIPAMQEDAAAKVAALLVS